MKSEGLKLLGVGLAVLIGGFGTAIVSIYSLIPFSAYTAIVGAAAFIIGLGLTALASTKISLKKNNNDIN